MTSRVLDGNLQQHLTTIDYRLLKLNPKLGLCHKDLPLEYKPPTPEVLAPEMADYVTQTSFAASTAIEAVDTLTLQIDHSMGGPEQQAAAPECRRARG
jgi:hypothetical protein